MIDAAQIRIFLPAAAVLAALPGPGMLYVLARSLRGGRPEGLASPLGTAAGGMVHVVFISGFVRCVRRKPTSPRKRSVSRPELLFCKAS